jgi:hypothetical protein
MIDGSDGESQIIMSRTVHFLSIAGAPEYPTMYADYACLGAKRPVYICTDFGSTEGVRVPDIDIEFTADKSRIVALNSVQSE